MNPADSTAPTGAVPAQDDLSWYLQAFLKRAPGVRGCVLSTLDGIASAHAGLNRDQSDTLAALIVGLYSLGASVGPIVGAPRSDVRQVVVEHGAATLFVMSTDGHLGAATGGDGTGAGTVGCALGVLTGPDADPGVIGREMDIAIGRVAEHLVAKTRGGAPVASGGQ